jgi:hypothetical protein
LVGDRPREDADEDGGASTVASTKRSRCVFRDESLAIVSSIAGDDRLLDSPLEPLLDDKTLAGCSVVASTLICGFFVVFVSVRLLASGAVLADELLDAATRTSIGSKALTSRTNDCWHLEQVGLNLPTLFGLMLIAFLQ